jgi:hypothetical protein
MSAKIGLIKSTDLHIWKTIKLGAGLKTGDEFCVEIEASGCKLGIWGKDILDKAVFTSRYREVDLVIKSVEELGFENGATRSQIYERAIGLGLQLCPSEVGPQLRLQYRNQPKDEWLLIGMQPVVDSDKVPSLFVVAEGGDNLWLTGDRGSANIRWKPQGRWVFIKPRK